jgi:hypothetical protein
MEFTRHARNEMRLYSISEEEVETVVAESREGQPDGRGNMRLVRKSAAERSWSS